MKMRHKRRAHHGNPKLLLRAQLIKSAREFVAELMVMSRYQYSTGGYRSRSLAWCKTTHHENEDFALPHLDTLSLDLMAGGPLDAVGLVPAGSTRVGSLARSFIITP